LVDRNLGNEDIFDIIRNPPGMEVIQIFEKPELWDTTKGLAKANKKSHDPANLRPLLKA